MLQSFIKEFNVKGGQYIYRDQLARRLYRKEKMLDVDMGGVPNTAALLFFRAVFLREAVQPVPVAP